MKVTTNLGYGLDKKVKESGQTFEAFYDKRREYRISTRRLRLPVVVEAIALPGKHIGLMVDLSPNGIGIETPYELPIFSQVTLIVQGVQLDPPSGLVGWVVWTQPARHSSGFRIGIRFAQTQQRFLQQMEARAEDKAIPKPPQP